MDLSTITVADFKAFFYRDFPYLPTYDPSALYNAGERVYYSVSRLFYDCLVNGTTGITPGTDATVWLEVADNIDNYIQDADISRAFLEAKVNLNQGLFTSDDNIRMGYLYLTAHYLCNDIRTASGGVGSSALFPLMARSVGNVSENYGIPQVYLDNPVYSFYTQSGYGMKYLSLVLPQLVGNIGWVQGWTNP